LKSSRRGTVEATLRSRLESGHLGFVGMWRGKFGSTRLNALVYYSRSSSHLPTTTESHLSRALMCADQVRRYPHPRNLHPPQVVMVYSSRPHSKESLATSAGCSPTRVSLQPIDNVAAVICRHGVHAWRMMRLVLMAMVLVIAGWNLAASTAVAAQADDLASGLDRLIVLPQALHVSTDYPAHLVVMRQSADGTMLPLAASDYTVQMSQPDLVHVDDRGWFHADKSGEATLTVSSGTSTVSMPLVVQSSEGSPPTFAREVSALLSKSGCNLGTCHGNLHGKGGLRFSLRGDDPEFDFASIVHDQGGRRVDWLESTKSLILRKPSGGLAHQGGVRLRSDSLGYDWMKRWIESEESQSSSIDLTKASNQLVELHVEPSRAVLPTSVRTAELVVWGKWADGTVRDVTRWARYEPNLTSGVSVSESGTITAEHPIDVAVAVSYLQARASTRITFLASDQATESPSNQSTPIDHWIQAQLDQLRIPTTARADENRILRRMFLVTVGRLPTADEVREFNADERPERLDAWRDRLLVDPMTARLWALRWSDVLRNEQKVMSQKGTQLFADWLTRQFAEDRPINDIMAELIRSVGSTFDNPPASFHRTHRDPMIAAESVGQVFLGVRMQCAKCHNHPFDVWKQDDYYGLAAYFTTLDREQIDNKRPDDLDKHVITGDEIIKLVSKQSEIWHPGRSISVGPRAFSANEPAMPPKSIDNPLAELADWVTRDNRQFARNMANRVWFHLMGRGIVDAPDDFRISNPPSNPELLEFLTDELIRSNYSVRHLSRLILSSEAFMRESVSQIASSDQLPAAASFAGYPLRRMPAELLLDAVADVTGVPLSKDGSRDGEENHRAATATTIPPSSSFVRAFGKPERLLVCECERSDQLSVRQSLMLLNGDDVRKRLNSRRSVLRKMMDRGDSDQQILDHLYLAALSRPATSEEQTVMLAHLQTSDSREEAFEDILWALLNSQEFVFIN
jgi:hypothetical protein